MATAKPKKCYYDVLCVAQNATAKEIKSAYKKLALVLHPDKNPGRKTEAKEEFQKLQQAYDILRNPQVRAWYDKQRDNELREEEEKRRWRDQQEAAKKEQESAATKTGVYDDPNYDGVSDDFTGLYCTACNKSFGTEIEFDDHKKSEKHLASEKQYWEKWKEEYYESTSDEEDMDDCDEKNEDALDIDVADKPESVDGGEVVDADEIANGIEEVTIESIEEPEDHDEPNVTSFASNSKKNKGKYRNAHLSGDSHDESIPMEATTVKEKSDNEAETVKASKKKRRRAKKGETSAENAVEKNDEVEEPGSADNTPAKCIVCNQDFPSRSKLFRHIKSTGHAAPITVVQAKSNAADSVKSGKKKKGFEQEDDDFIVDLFPYFTSACFTGYNDEEKGFYTVYREVFELISTEELDAGCEEDIPSFGDSLSSYDDVVGPFYGFWECYCTCKSFMWKDEYDSRRAGNRMVTRMKERENTKVRAEAKKAWNQQVRALVDFVKRKDKRVQEWRAQQELARKEKEAAVAKKMQEEKTKKKNEPNIVLLFKKVEGVFTVKIANGIEKVTIESTEEPEDHDEPNVTSFVSNSKKSKGKYRNAHLSGDSHDESIPTEAATAKEKSDNEAETAKGSKKKRRRAKKGETSADNGVEKNGEVEEPGSADNNPAECAVCHLSFPSMKSLLPHIKACWDCLR